MAYKAKCRNKHLFEWLQLCAPRAVNMPQKGIFSSSTEACVDTAISLSFDRRAVLIMRRAVKMRALLWPIEKGDNKKKGKEEKNRNKNVDNFYGIAEHGNGHFISSLKTSIDCHASAPKGNSTAPLVVDTLIEGRPTVLVIYSSYTSVKRINVN